MRRRDTRRRFDEPRCGVSQLMVEAESRELTRELDSYLRSSIDDLNERLAERLKLYRQNDQSLIAAVNRLPERERLAIGCMLSRDLWLLQLVYLDFLQKHEPQAHASAVTAEPIELPFSESLFSSIQ